MALLLALSAIALWSTNALVAKYVLQILPVEQVQFLQFLGAFFVFFLIALSRRELHRQFKLTRVAWILGIIGLPGTMIFQYLAFAAGPITEVNIIAYAWPLIAAVFIVVIGDALRPISLLLLAVFGFIGAVMVIGGDQLASMNISVGLSGFVTAAISALCMAIYSCGIGRTSINVNDILLPASGLGLIITALWCFFGASHWGALGPLLAGLYLGVGPMGLGYLFWSLAMQKDPSGRTALMAFLTPITSTMLLLTNGEVLETYSMIGAVIVIVCCSLIGVQSQRPKNV